MKWRIFALALASLGITFLPRAGAQNFNHTPGTVVGWGDQVIPYVKSGTRYKAISAGETHSLALKMDGTVVAWGNNSSGQSAVPTNLTNVIAIAAGGTHSLALKSDGTVIAWGVMYHNGNPNIMMPTNLTGVIAISAGFFSSLALKSDGTVVAWGEDSNSRIEVPANLTNVIAIAAGQYHSLALKSDGTVVSWGDQFLGSAFWMPASVTNVIAIAVGGGQNLALKSDGRVVAWGVTNVPTNLTGVIAISAGYSHNLALKSDGTVVAWGKGMTNNPSNGSDYGQSIVPTNLNSIIAIAAGYYHSLALKSDGTVVAWGDNNFSQSMAASNLANVIAISAGYNNNLVLKSDGTVIAWGDNFNGQSAVPTNLTNVTAIAAGGVYCLALKSDGTVVAWGDNWYGESTVPANLTNVTAIAAGYYHSLALKSDGTVVAWGNNSYGMSTVPTNLTNVIAIAAGGVHSLVLKSDGTVIAWGDNYCNNVYVGQSMVPTNLAGVVAIAAGDTHSLALKLDGTVVAWGNNSSGQSAVPANLTNVTAIAAGRDQSLALKSDGRLIAWGLSDSGLGTVAANLTNVIAVDAGYYRSLALVAPSNQSPLIAVQPASQTVQLGNNVAFSVTASGNPAPNYQWQFNGQNIAGQTATSLSLTNVQFANAGGYSVVVTNGYGSVTSAVAQLTVFTNLPLIQTNRTPTTEIGTATIPTDNRLKLFTNGTFQSGVALNPNVMTVVMTHGWNSSPGEWANNMAYLTLANLPNPKPNIVAWDWSLDASSAWYDLRQIADKTPGEGWALCRTLVQSLGTNYSKRIHFIGHSLGTLVNGAAAEYLQENGFAGTNMQMTLFDEAEVAWGFDGLKWKSVTTLATLSANLSTPTVSSFHGPLPKPPKQFAWADNYVSAFGLLHPEAVNVIMTNGFPVTAPDLATLSTAMVAFHGYPYGWYDETIQTDVSVMGFRWSFERGGFNGAPATNTFYIQTGSQWNLVTTNFVYASQVLDARVQKYWAAIKGTGLETVGNVMTDNGQVTGQMLATGPANAWDMIFHLNTGTGGGTPQIQSLNVKPLGGPVPNALNGTNTPAYAWIPLNVPSNAVSMSFNFMLQGNGNEDSFQVALHGTNILSLETVLIQTNVTMNSGLIDVSQYAGQQVELFLGIVGGTSTNAALTVSDFQFYVTLPPSLQIELSGTNVVLTWPLSGAGYVLEKTDKLTPTNLWATVTNVPAIVDFQYTVTNQISGAARFYRLSE